MNLKLKPTTDKYLMKFVDMTFTQIFMGNSIAIQVIPKAGSYGLIKYILDCPELISREFQKSYNRFRFLNLDLLSITSQTDLWNELRSLLKFPKSKKKQEILDALKNDTKKHILIINNADLILEDTLSAIFPFLTKLYNFNAGFFLLFPREMKNNELERICTPLGIHYQTIIPLKSQDDIKVLLEKEEIWYQYSIPNEVKSILIKLSGGYSSLARSLLALANKNYKKFKTLSKTEIANDPNVKTRLLNVIRALSSSSQSLILKNLLTNNKNQAAVSKYIKETKILQNENDQTRFFSSLLPHMLKEQIRRTCDFTKEAGKLYRLGSPIDTLLSPNEFKIFSFLYKQASSLTSREDLAKKIWGSDWTNKYSDWAIDQNIYNIRRKLILDKQTLETVKGKGFRLNI